MIVGDVDAAREIDAEEPLEGAEFEVDPAADEASSGPASMMLVDPDGNPILIDQHVPKPGSSKP